MTSHPHSEYPALLTMAHIYFDEDWPDFYDEDPMLAVDAFANGQPGLAENAPLEIEAILALSPTEDELGRRFVELDLLYDPPSMDGISYRDWLISVSDRVRGTLAARG